MKISATQHINSDDFEFAINLLANMQRDYENTASQKAFAQLKGETEGIIKSRKAEIEAMAVLKKDAEDLLVVKRYSQAMLLIDYSAKVHTSGKSKEAIKSLTDKINESARKELDVLKASANQYISSSDFEAALNLLANVQRDYENTASQKAFAQLRDEIGEIIKRRKDEKKKKELDKESKDQ